MSACARHTHTLLPLFLLAALNVAIADECCKLPDLRQVSQAEETVRLTVGVEYGYTQTDSLQDGTHSLSQSEALNHYHSRPTEMTSHRVETYATYAFNPTYELTLALPWIHNSMTMQSFMSDHSTCGLDGAFIRRHQGKGFTHPMGPVEGFGDLLLEGSVRLWTAGDEKSSRQQLFFKPGLKTPTGDYKATESGVQSIQTPYGRREMKHGGGYIDPCMQLGTGSWDPIAQLGYRLDRDRFALDIVSGYQLTTRNSLGYEYGDVASLGLYPSYWLFSKLRLVTGFRHRHVESADDHSGRYTDKETMTKVAANTGGEFTDAVLALDLQPWESVSFNIGVNIPVWSDLNGMQMEPGELYTCGASVRF